MPEKSKLTREALLNGDIERLLQKDRSDPKRMTDDQRAKLVRTTTGSLGENAELWIFGYGSLIWNPAFEFAEQRRCRIQGYQKKFCFWTTLSRGTEECPGLMAGLVAGGNCNGVAYRIATEKWVTELDVLFRREMAYFVYKPTWVNAQCLDTNINFRALTFVVDTENERFARNLTQKKLVSTLATARGPLGRNCDYLFQLSDKLQELGLHDPELEELVQRVIEYQTRQ